VTEETRQLNVEQRELNEELRQNIAAMQTQSEQGRE
jgi:glucose-6-phosphate-specific signal transduction histidine kinase